MDIESQENSRFAPKNRLPQQESTDLKKGCLPAIPQDTEDEATNGCPSFVYRNFTRRISDPPAQRFVGHFSPRGLPRGDRAAEDFFRGVDELIHAACRLTPTILGDRPLRGASENLISHSSIFSITLPEDPKQETHLGVIYQFGVEIKDTFFSFIPDLDGIRWGNPELLAPSVITRDPLLVLVYTPRCEVESAAPSIFFREIVSPRAVTHMISAFNKSADRDSQSLLASPLFRAGSQYSYQLLNSIVRPVLENAIMRTFEIDRNEYDELRALDQLSVLGASISPPRKTPPIADSIAPSSSEKKFPATVLVERTDRLSGDGALSEIFQFDLLLRYNRPGNMTCESLAPGAQIDSSDYSR